MQRGMAATRTLLGVFTTAEAGRTAARHFEEAGYTVQVIDSPTAAGAVARGESEDGTDGKAGGAASGAAIGGLVSGGVGAVPGAWLGRLVGGWLASHRAEQYERDVANGGVLLIVQAEELAPAARAEQMLYQLGAEHVENGEVAQQS
jgi:hypothetical protein